MKTLANKTETVDLVLLVCMSDYLLKESSCHLLSDVGPLILYQASFEAALFMKCIIFILSNSL